MTFSNSGSIACKEFVGDNIGVVIFSTNTRPGNIGLHI